MQNSLAAILIHSFVDFSQLCDFIEIKNTLVKIPDTIALQNLWET